MLNLILVINRKIASLDENNQGARISHPKVARGKKKQKDKKIPKLGEKERSTLPIFAEMIDYLSDYSRSL